jgi:transcriptional regulator with XRE-family HTH domain
MTTAYESGNVPRIEVRHRLRIAREYVGLEQKQLADLIGVSRTTIGNAETGMVKPRRITINAWALACGVPASWILTGTSSTPPDGGPLPINQPTGLLRLWQPPVLMAA